MITIDLISLQKFERKLDKCSLAVEVSSFRGVQQGARHVLEVSQERVPVRTGALKNSGKVTVDEELKIVTISYGDSTLSLEGTPTRDYAARIHETLNEKNPVGFKYLETAFDDSLEEVLNLIGDSIKKELG
jgi:hypothetical protein